MISSGFMLPVIIRVEKVEEREREKEREGKKKEREGMGEGRRGGEKIQEGRRRGEMNVSSESNGKVLESLLR